MKKIVVLIVVCAIAMFSLMAIGETYAETANDFESLADCMEKMGISGTYEIEKDVMWNYVDSNDKDGFIAYVRQVVELDDCEDMMVLSIGGDQKTPYAGLVYGIAEKELRMSERTIIRVIVINLV